MKRKKKQFKNFLKCFVLVVGGLALFILGSRQAFHQRGYEAIGGEIFLLLLPFIFYEIEEMFKELVEEIKNDFKTEAHGHGRN